MSRKPFSISLDEDYEIYGIDPNENLDDWSFLEAKPEPLPEKDEEEKRLFEQLMAPTIPDDEIQSEIHDRLKSLIEETSNFIANDVKVELSAPIEIPEIEVQQNVNRESFEYKQSQRLSTIVKDLLHPTQEAENIDDLIQTLTKSDEIAEKIKEEQETSVIEEPSENEKQSKKNNKSLSKTSPAAISSSKSEEKPEEAPPPQPSKGLLDRYKRKVGAKTTIIRDQDETERLRSKYLLEKQKREEENKAELEKAIKAREARQKDFFKSLDLEVEKHKREVQMIKEIKESKGPSLTEMINQIRPQKETNDKKNGEIKPELLKSSKKPEKPPPRYTKEKIEEFLSMRKKKLETKPTAPVLMIELSTNKEETEQSSSSKSKKSGKASIYLSSTYQKKVAGKLAPILLELFKKLKSKDTSKQWKIAIFFRMAYHLKLYRLFQKIQQNKLKRLLKKWRSRRKRQVFKKSLAAITIQRAFRKNKERRNKPKKEITDQQILGKVRQLINQQVPETSNNSPPSQKYQQKKPKPNFGFPVLNDPDTSWIETFDKDGNGKDDFFDNELLDELPNKQILRFDEPPPPAKKHHQKNYQTDSQSVPVDNTAYDYLAKFGQKIELQDNEEQDVDIFEQAHLVAPKKRSKSRTGNTDETNNQPDNNEEQQQQQNNKGDTSLKDGYNFKNQETEKFMQKMLNKKNRQSNSNKNEKPVEKFNRLYRGTNQPTVPHHAPNIKHTPNMKTDFKAANTRAQRLKNLKKVWLSQHNDQETDQADANTNGH